MITSRTPFRLSLCGGGTDFPASIRKFGGITVGGSIDKYSFITARVLPPFHSFKHRLVYREIETVDSVDDVHHLAAQACMRRFNFDEANGPGLEICHLADLPGRSGTGSSSTFVVGLLKALSALKGRLMLPHELASAAIDIEQNWLNENVGCQDQTFAAYGGLNVIQFRQDGEIDVLPLVVDHDHVRELEQHLLLFFTGISRTSSEVAATYVPTLEQKEKEQFAMMRLTHDAIDAIYSRRWEKLGQTIDQSWRIKSGLSAAVATPEIHRLYATARLHGAFGGKLTGAGGGGCFILVAPPEKHLSIIETMTASGCVHIPFRFEWSGSTVIFSDRNNIKAQ